MLSRGLHSVLKATNAKVLSDNILNHENFKTKVLKATNAKVLSDVEQLEALEQRLCFKGHECQDAV